MSHVTIIVSPCHKMSLSLMSHVDFKKINVHVALSILGV